MKPVIYLDYAATTPADPRVVKKMLQFLDPASTFANPASAHVSGKAAKIAVDEARQQIADVLHAQPDEIIFTSGATESINLALKGAAQLYQQQGRHIVTLATEHSAVLDSCQWLEKKGFPVTQLIPGRDGLLQPGQLENALRPDTFLVSVSAVNNETGIVQDLKKIAATVKNHGILLHIDGAQMPGKIQFDLNDVPADLVSLSGHKVYGPKGIGALYVRRKPRVRVAAQIHGGGQEQGMRSGTLAMHQIAGMGEAFAIAKNEFAKNIAHIQALRENFLKILAKHTEFEINGCADNANNYVPQILNLYFPDMPADKLMAALPHIAISSGSACHSKGMEPSHVLRAMGLSFKDAHCCVRISFGRFTTLDEVKTAAQEIGMYVAGVKP